MYRPDKPMAEMIWLSLVKNWTAKRGAEERIKVNNVKMVAQIPAHNQYDLWLWSWSKAQNPRLRGRFNFNKI
jgi:hypothetical protein